MKKDKERSENERNLPMNLKIVDFDDDDDDDSNGNASKPTNAASSTETSSNIERKKRTSKIPPPQVIVDQAGKGEKLSQGMRLRGGKQLGERPPRKIVTGDTTPIKVGIVARGEKDEGEGDKEEELHVNLVHPCIDNEFC